MNHFFKILFFFLLTTVCLAQPSEQQKLEARKAEILKEISENKLRLESEKKNWLNWQMLNLERKMGNGI